MATDSEPNWMGVWWRNQITSPNDFNGFLVWINGRKGFSVEGGFGLAEITGWKIDNENVEFGKRYVNPKFGGGESEIDYFGTYKEDFYRGTWQVKDSQGSFALEPSSIALRGSSITEMLGRCNLELLRNKINEHRKQFPYSPIKEVLRDFR